MDRNEFVNTFDKAAAIVADTGLDLALDLQVAGYSIRLGAEGWVMVIIDTGAGERLGSFQVRIDLPAKQAAAFLYKDAEYALARFEETKGRVLKEAA